MLDPIQGLVTMSNLRFLLLFTLVLAQSLFTSAAQPKPPQNLIASEITASSFKLSWKKGNPDDHMYKIRYRAQQDDKFREITGIRGTEYKMENMQAFQHYEVKILAVTHSAESPETPTIDVVTGELGAYL